VVCDSMQERARCLKKHTANDLQPCSCVWCSHHSAKELAAMNILLVHDHPLFAKLYQPLAEYL